MDLGSNLKRFRIENGFSQGDLAEKLNVSRQAVSRWETGKTQPDIETLKTISVLYSTTLDELLDYHTTKNKKKVFISEMESIEPIEPFMYMVLLLLASQIALIGILISIYILLRYSKKYSRFLKVLSIVCMVYCLYKTGVFLHYMTFDGTGTIESL